MINNHLDNVKTVIDLDNTHISYQNIIQYFRNSQVVPFSKLYLLSDDETIQMDVSEDLKDYSLTITYQSGQRRTLSVTLVNKDNKWQPKYNTGIAQIGSKFRFDLGFIIGDVLYRKQMGIFLLKDPSRTLEYNNNSISFSLCDKFGLFDGSLSGKTGLKDIVPVGVSIYQAFVTIITADKGNGIPYDMKKILFNSKYKNQNTYYTFKQDAGGVLSDILIELAQTISSDVYYNEYGNLCIESNTNDFINANLPLAWHFNGLDSDAINISFNETSNNIVNHIIVKGNIVNGYQFSAVAKNNNPLSNTCIQYRGDLFEIIKDESLYSDELCHDRAQYELLQRTRGTSTCTISTSFLPIFDVNQSVIIDSILTNDNNNNYVIDSLTFSNTGLSMSLSNINEIIF